MINEIIIPEYCYVVDNKHGKYCLNHKFGNDPCVKDILNGDTYECLTIEYILNNHNCKDVVHAGAYFGDTIVSIYKIPGNIYAFEPNPYNYECAKLTLELNDIRNVNLYNYALWNESKDLKLKDNGGLSKVSDNGVDIKGVRIDDIVNTEVNIIHLDIETSEYQALIGAKDTIKTYNPILILEFPKGNVTDLIKDWGYKLDCKFHNNSAYVHEDK